MVTLMWGMLFGCIGMGYIMYGRKQRNGIALVAGIVLCGFSYFIPNTILMVIVGVIIAAVPFFIKQ